MSGGIKRRDRKIDTAAVEAFGAGAETHTVTPPHKAAPKPQRQNAAAAAVSDERLPKSMEVRFPDADLPARIRAIAVREDRSRHKIALMALELGLAQLERQ